MNQMSGLWQRLIRPFNTSAKFEMMQQYGRRKAAALQMQLVICKYFQQGTCRFGTKCSNEHFDVRQLVKSDVEASINGKQWPFSCYGPFKDKPCIPNFIEDQSTEEVRFLCYEAKKSNMFEQFHQQFTKEAVECNNKMKALLQMSPEIFEVVSQIYNTPEAGAAGGGNPNNPFKVNQPAGGGLFGSAAPATNASNNVFGGFGKPATQASNGAGNIFGQAAANNNAAASIFGGGNNQQQQQNSIFGAAAAQAPATNSIFGGAPQQSMFGGQVQNQQQAGGIFGQAAQQQQPTGGGLFGKPAQPVAGGGAAGFGLFAQAAQQAPPAFGQAPSLFGGQQQPSPNVFGGQQPQQPANNGNIFGSQMQQQQQQSAPGPFGQAQSAQGIFGQPQQVQQQQQQQPPPGFFGQPQQQQGGGLFGQQQQQAPPAGFFASASAMPPQQQPTEGVFGQAASMQFKPPQSGAFILTTNTYTPLENLSQDDLNAFQAEQFEPGHIPFCPPPQQLV